eukprot:gene32273-16840_t
MDPDGPRAKRSRGAAEPAGANTDGGDSCRQAKPSSQAELSGLEAGPSWGADPRGPQGGPGESGLGPRGGASAHSGEVSLTDEQLMEVFNAALHGDVVGGLGQDDPCPPDSPHSSLGSPDGKDDSENVSDFWSDDDDTAGGTGVCPPPASQAKERETKEREAREGAKGAAAQQWDKQARESEGRAKPPKVPRGATTVKPTGRGSHAQVRQRRSKHQIDMYDRDLSITNVVTATSMRRRGKTVGRDEVVHIKIPAAPLPPSWGRTVKPWEPVLPYRVALPPVARSNRCRAGCTATGS